MKSEERVRQAYLHVTDGNAVVPAVTDDLVLDLLPALHTLLDEYLWTCRKRLAAERLELIVVLSEARSETAESVGGTNDDGISDRVRGSDGLFERRRSARLRATLPNLSHGARKELSVLRHDDRVDRRAEDLAPKRREFVLEFDADVERGLASESDVDAVGLLVLDDLAHELGGDRQEVDLVGETLGRRDRRNVRVDEDRIDALLLESLDSLGAGVVKLAGLADGQASRAKDEDLLNVSAGNALLVVLFLATRHRDRDKRARGKAIDDVLDEHVEQELRIAGSRSRLRVELHGKERLVDTVDTLVALVVRVAEELLPSLWKSRGIDLETVILTRDVAPSAERVRARNVVSAVTILHLGCGRASGESE